MRDDDLKRCPAGYVLVVASSGRMLAKLASKANYLPLVVDLFADQDTVVIAEQVWQVGSLSLSCVQPLIESLSALFTIKWVVMVFSYL